MPTVTLVTFVVWCSVFNIPLFFFFSVNASVAFYNVDGHPALTDLSKD